MPAAASPKGLRVTNPTKGFRSKVYVYEQHEGKLEVRKHSDINHKDYQTIKIPPKTKQLSLFTDPTTNSDVKTEEEALEGEHVLDYVLLARLHLDSFGLWNKVLLKSGLRDHLYLSGREESR